MDEFGIGRGGGARRRLGLLLGFAASVLLGMLLGGWINPLAPSPLPAAGTSAHAVASISPTPGLALCLLLLLVAALLMQRSRDALQDGVPRDPQTGLYLAPFVAESLRNQFARDDREGRSRLALVVIDIDRLDHLRTRYGGDVVRDAIALLGRQIRSQARQGDLPLHLAHGRFAVYLQCEELEQATAFCRRLTMLLARDQLDLNGDVVKLTASTGVALRNLAEPLGALRMRAEAMLQQTSPGTQDSARQHAAGLSMASGSAAHEHRHLQ